MNDREVPQPDETPADVNEVVESANESLAEAEAAALTPETTVDPDLAAFEEAERSFPGSFGGVTTMPAAAQAAQESTVEEVVVEDAPVETFRYDETVINEATPDMNAPVTLAYAPTPDVHAPVTPAYAPTAYDQQTSVLPADAVAPVVPVPQAPQPIFVQAPEPPRERGNRGVAGAIGLLAAVAFGVLYLAVRLIQDLVEGSLVLGDLGTAALSELRLWEFWVPVVVFFLGFWLLGAIVNRARWAYWVIFGLVVGVIAWGGHILGQLLQAPFWRITPSEGLALFEAQVFAPLAIASFIIGRELTVWFGAWVARSGARKTELNAEAQREYERTLEAGPTLAGR